MAWTSLLRSRVGHSLSLATFWINPSTTRRSPARSGSPGLRETSAFLVLDFALESSPMCLLLQDAQRTLSGEPSVKYCAANCVFRKTPFFFWSIPKATSAFISISVARSSVCNRLAASAAVAPCPMALNNSNSTAAGPAFLKNPDPIPQVLKWLHAHKTV
jgi:hypothetical protein